MTRIDFYTLEPDSPGDRLILTCRLVEDALAAKRRVLIHCPDQALAGQLDRMLWTFRRDSFLPHGLVGTLPADLLELTPALISGDGAPADEHQVMINLAAEVPPFFSRFEQVMEPIDTNPAERESGRERFRFYRDRGYPLTHHAMRLAGPADQAW